MAHFGHFRRFWTKKIPPLTARGGNQTLKFQVFIDRKDFVRHITESDSVSQ